MELNLDMERGKYFTSRPIEGTLIQLQRFQHEHDKTFHQDVFSMPTAKQINHIMFHVAKIGGRLADYCDKLDHGEVGEAEPILLEMKERRAPDLLIFALMLANRLGIDLQDAYFARIEHGERIRAK